MGMRMGHGYLFDLPIYLPALYQTVSLHNGA